MRVYVSVLTPQKKEYVQFIVIGYFRYALYVRNATYTHDIIAVLVQHTDMHVHRAERIARIL